MRNIFKKIEIDLNDYSCWQKQYKKETGIAAEADDPNFYKIEYTEWLEDKLTQLLQNLLKLS